MTIESSHESKDKTSSPRKSDNYLLILAMAFLALSVSFFVFRKRLMEKIINSKISFEIISTAAAQEPPKGGNGLSFPELEGPLSSLHPVPGVLGFQLSGRLEDLPKDCAEMARPFYLASFILADISDEDYFIKMNECLKRRSKKAKWVLQYGTVGFPMTSKEKALVEQVRKKMASKDGLWKIIQSDLLEIEFEKQESLIRLAKILNQLEAWSDVVSTVAKIYIYANLGNEGKVETLAKERLVKSEYQLFYESEFPYPQASLAREKLAMMLKSVNQKFIRNKIFQAFLLKLWTESSPEMRSVLSQNMNFPASEKMAEAFYSSPTLGGNYPLAWAKWAGHNLSEKKLDSLFQNVKSANNLENLYILRFHHPLSEERRTELGADFKKLGNSSAPIHKTLYFEALKNEEWRRHFSARMKEDLKPFFREKRNFYKKNLEQNQALLFSIYNLFSLGDFEREYFLKLLAIRSYGLPATQILPL